MTTTMNTASIAISPGVCGYVCVQKSGRHGSVIDRNAVGRRCMKAVARSTPVPKGRERKRNRCGIGSLGNRRAMIGNEHANLYINTGHLLKESLLTECAQDENKEEGKDVDARVVGTTPSSCPAGGLCGSILSALEFCLENVEREFAQE